MELMLPFDEYCEICSEFKATHDSEIQIRSNLEFSLHTLKNNINALRVKALFVVDPSQTNAIFNLINQCNSEMIEELMEYFDESAPIQKLLENRRKELSKEKEKNLNSVVKTQKSSYPVYDVLIDEMKIKGYETDADLYNYIDMDRRVFGKFRKKGATISRENALWFAVGFELNYPEAADFLAKLGYAFKYSDAREQLIAHVMRTRRYRFREMQSILYSFGFKMFGEVKE